MYGLDRCAAVPHAAWTPLCQESTTVLAPAVVVGGWVRHPLRLSAPALRERGARGVEFRVVCPHDGASGVPQRMQAVPLRTLIEEAQPAFEHGTDFKRMAIVAESSEGYRALFSWNELFNTSVGEGVMVAFDDPSARLPAPTGAFALLSLNDLHTGPRYVRHLAMIELVKLW